MSATANTDQIEYWNEVAGPRWVRMQTQLDAQLDSLGTAALDRARLAPGDRVLDIGCGCGALSLGAASRVGPRGSVIGIDLSRPMLDRARERASAAGLAMLEFVRADVQTHAFPPASADAIVSRFGIMFFASPETAFANLRTALGPDGRLTFACWQPMTRNPWMAVPTAAAARFVALPPPPDPGAPGPFSLADPDRVRGILSVAGFDAIEIESLEGLLPVGGARTAKQAGEFMLEVGPVLRALGAAAADAALRRKVAVAVAEALEPFTDASGVHAPYAAWIVSARSS